MLEVAFDGLAKHIEGGTIQSWLLEEGDPVHKGDDLVEISTDDGVVMVTAPADGILAEVYYDEGESVGRGEILCMLDDDDDKKKEDEEPAEEDEDEEDEESDEDEEEDDDDDEEEEDEEDEDDEK